jgi:uncharacterized protein (TIGR00251 family)
MTAATLAVKVVPGASRNRVAGRYGDGVKVQVAAAPERGKANAAVIDVLAQWLGVKPNHIELISAPTNPHKHFRISGLDTDTIQAKLASLPK